MWKRPNDLNVKDYVDQCHRGDRYNPVVFAATAGAEASQIST